MHRERRRRVPGQYETPARYLPSRLRTVVAVTLIAVSAQALGQSLEERDLDEPPAPTPAGEPKETTPNLSSAERMILDQTNQFRQEQELPTVEPNDKLNETAQYFADFMARTDKYGHTADDQRPSERAANHGYDYCIVSENIAYQYRSTGFSADQLADRFVTGWKQSPEHRKNMVDPDVTEIGVAIARKKESPTYFAVQMFGRPQAKSISFEVTNRSDAEIEYTVTRRGSEKTFPLPPRARRTHQRCRPTTIAFSTPDATFQVNGGKQYVVTRSNAGKLEVTGQQQ